MKQTKAELNRTRVLGKDESGGVVASDLYDEIKFCSTDDSRLLRKCSANQFKHAVALALERPVFAISEDSERSVFVRIHITGVRPRSS